MSIYVEICHTVSDISDVFFRNHAKIITSKIYTKIKHGGTKDGGKLQEKDY